MKKYFIVALASVAALTLASCVKESSSNMTEEKTINNSQELITITARIPEGGFTKVDLAEASYGGAINLTWHEGDKIIVTDADDETNTQEFTLTDGEGTAEGTFTGKAVTADSYIIVYDSIGDEFEFSEQTQAADATIDHLKYKATLEGVNDYTDFVFSDLGAAALGGTFNSSSVLRVRAKLGDLDPADVNAVILKADEAIFAGGYELKVNIATPGEDEGEMDFITVYATMPDEDIVIPDGTGLVAQFQMSDKSYDKYTVYRELGVGTITGGKVNSFNIDCGENFTKFANKSDDEIGTAANPYLVGDQHQMAALRNNLESGITYIKLVDDIDLTGIEWVPLNYDGTYDKGVYFDGDHHTIANLNVTSGYTYSSFFGVLNGTVKDVTFESAVISSTDKSNAGVVGGYIGTGSYDGICEGVTVNNATVTVNVTEGKGRFVGAFAGQIGTATSSITNCHVSGTVVVTNNTSVDATSASNAGGFVGFTDKTATITGCTVSGDVTVTMNTTKTGCSAGGFIGNLGAAATLTGCTAQANVSNATSYYTGGFIGQIGSAVTPTIENCAFLGGNLTSERSNNNSPVGGFVGRIAGGAGVTITNCYVDGAYINAPNSGRCGGFIGDAGSNVTANSFVACYVINSTISGGINSGGFAGTYGNASKCYVESTTITANKDNAGGFIAYFEDSIIENCYTTATVVGGGYANIGGFIGNCRMGNKVGSSASYCFANGTVSGTAGSVGAFIGGVTAVPTSVTKNIGWSNTLLFVGSDGDFDISEAITGNYCGTEGTISSQANALGWNTTVWNLTGSVPVLR